jgi:hypothetical protein
VEPHKPRYIFICDPGIPGCGDPDDLKCLILAARAHRTGRAVLEGVIALNDAEGGWGRAALARALLKHLGCDEVPVAVGDTGEFPAPDAEHVSGYLPAVAISELHDGHNLLRRLVNDSAPRSITLVAIAPMMDLAILVRRRPDLCLHAFREVCVQGGIVRDASGAWQPDRSGNMASDEAHDAAHVVYSFCLENSVRLTVYQRDAVPLLPMSLAKGLALDHPDDPIMRLLVDSQVRTPRRAPPSHLASCAALVTSHQHSPSCRPRTNGRRWGSSSECGRWACAVPSRGGPTVGAGSSPRLAA